MDIYYGCARFLDVLINTPYLQLGQLLKLVGAIGNGGEAKLFLASHDVLVNGEIDRRRGRKLYDRDVVSFSSSEYVVVGGK